VVSFKCAPTITVITDEAGNVTERRSYDAWGKRRNQDGTAMTNAFVTPDVRHGFADDEELDEVGLVNMNGRLYDPATGRFMSADPTVQYPGDMQNYNRYSYIDNNPLCTIDPSGYGFFDDVFGAIGDLIGGVVSAVTHVVKAILNNSVIRTAISVYVGYQLGVGDWQLFGSNAIANGAAGGFAAGLIQGRGDLRAAISGAVSGAAFGWAGGIGNADSLERYAAHAFAGCAGALIGGGDCARGAVSAVAGKFATNNTPSSWGDFGKFAATVIAGGTASVIGGGKFENGAFTAAMGYLFNQLTHSYPSSNNSIVDRAVAQYNAEYGYSTLDPEYLDPNLIKAMIRVESGVNLTAYNNDPMQVNVNGDWVSDKADIGLVQGVAPGSDLGIQAGVEWLTNYKAYAYDANGNAISFRGWDAAVTRYNGGGDPNYLSKVKTQFNILQCGKPSGC
jgi:RHS repeat-associated protein